MNVGDCVCVNTENLLRTKDCDCLKNGASTHHQYSVRTSCTMNTMSARSKSLTGRRRSLSPFQYRSFQLVSGLPLRFQRECALPLRCCGKRSFSGFHCFNSQGRKRRDTHSASVEDGKTVRIFKYTRTDAISDASRRRGSP